MNRRLKSAREEFLKGIFFLLFAFFGTWPNVFAFAEMSPVWSFQEGKLKVDILLGEDQFEPRLNLRAEGINVEGIRSSRIGRGLLIELPNQPLAKARTFALGSFPAVRAVQFLKHGTGSRISVLPGAEGNLRLSLKQEPQKLDLQMSDAQVIAQALPPQQPLFRQWGVETKERVLGQFKGDIEKESPSSEITSQLPHQKEKVNPEKFEPPQREIETLKVVPAEVVVGKGVPAGAPSSEEVLWRVGSRLVYHTPSSPGIIEIDNPGDQEVTLSLNVSRREPTGEFRSTSFDPLLSRASVKVPAGGKARVALSSSVLNAPEERAFQVAIRDKQRPSEKAKESPYSLVLVQPDEGLARIRWERSKGKIILANEGNISTFFQRVRVCQRPDRCHPLPSFRLYPAMKKTLDLAKSEELRFEQKLQYVAREATIPAVE